MKKAEEKEEENFSIDEAEKVKKDLMKKKEIIEEDKVKIEMKKMIDPLVLKKNLIKQKITLKKNFLIKKKDFQVEIKVLETKLFQLLSDKPLQIF